MALVISQVITFTISIKPYHWEDLNLEIQKDYKCKKPIIIYNYFTSNLDNQIINNSNQIKLNQNSELILIEYNISEKCKFLKNTFEKININKGSELKTFIIQKAKCNGYFYKNISGTQDYNSTYQNFILSSGLKFNKIEINMDLEKKRMLVVIFYLD